MKLCKMCGINKEEIEFNRQAKSKDGYKSYCRNCDATKNAIRYEANKDKIKQNVRKWQSENKEKFNSYIKRYRGEHEKP